MKKIKYLFQRIIKMNYSQMFKTIKKIHKQTGKNSIYLFLDMIYCGIKHEAGYVDYEYYKMYKLSEEKRATIMTRGRSNYYVSQLNPKEYWHLFNNKDEFNKLFDKYLGRDWMYINGNNFDEFLSFTKKHKIIIVKPNDLSCGKGVEKIDSSNCDINELYQKLIDNKTFLVEEVAKQNKQISKIHPDSVNTIRIVTIIDDFGNPNVATAVIRIGTNHNVVDNFNSGGITAMIDVSTGKVNSPAINANGEIFKKHPTTNVKIEGYQIPMWDEIKKLVLEAAMVEPNIRLVGWDICVGENEPVIIEGNQFPSHDLYQPLFGINGIDEGIVPLFEKIIHEKK